MERWCFVAGMTAALVAGSCGSGDNKKSPELLSPFGEWDTPIHDGLSSQTALTSEDLVGKWAKQGDSSYAITFERDGTFVPMYDGVSATWSTAGRILTVHYDEIDDDDLYGEARESTPFAIVDDMFFDKVFIRTDGSGSGLDGTWHIAMQIAESYHKYEDDEDVQYAISIEAEFVIQNATSGAAGESPTFTYTHQLDYVSFTDESYEDHELSSGSGNVIVENNAVYLDITEEEGQGFRCFDFFACPVPSDEEALLGQFLGYRIADDILVASGSATLLEWETFVRQ